LYRTSNALPMDPHEDPHWVYRRGIREPRLGRGIRLGGSYVQARYRQKERSIDIALEKADFRADAFYTVLLQHCGLPKTHPKRADRVHPADTSTSSAACCLAHPTHVRYVWCTACFSSVVLHTTSWIPDKSGTARGNAAGQGPAARVFCDCTSCVYP
jgi:hypothetical protein